MVRISFDQAQSSEAFCPSLTYFLWLAEYFRQLLACQGTMLLNDEQCELIFLRKLTAKTVE